MRILVTGACGRIGSHAVRQLHDRGIPVEGIDSVIHPGNLRELTDQVHIEAVDIQDLAALIELLQRRKYTHIIHLAAAIGAQYDRKPWISYSVNLGGTINILEAARLGGVQRVAMASTHNIYPKTYADYGHPKWLPIAEDHPPEPTRPYAVMKLACEYMGRIFAQRGDLEFAAVRYSSYYGAERALRRGRMAPDVLNWFILDAVEGKPSRIEHGGDQVFDPVYIKDCAHGVICAALADRTMDDGQIYNIGGGQGMTLSEAAVIVRETLPGADIEVGPGLDFSPAGTGHHPWLDITRARTEIAYEPQYDLAAGVGDCAAELRKILGL